MTPKEKAVELVEKYFTICHKSSDLELSWKVCKKCALIAVDEMLDFRNAMYINEGGLAHKYLLEIKTEIEKL